MDRVLFRLSEWLSSPPGFSFLLVVMAAITLFVTLGWTDLVAYILSVAAIMISGVVLIQGYRDTAPIHAKLDEFIPAQCSAHNGIVNIEQESLAAIGALADEAGDPNCRDGL